MNMTDSNRKMNQIFMSYRREDNAGVTGRIYDRLVQRFGKKAIFKDIDSIPLGVDFRQHIDGIVQECDAVLIVMGDKWAGDMKRTGKRRIDNPEDFVRIEIESALQRNIRVIPLLIQNASMPSESSLPESLKGLATRNGITIGHDPHFHSDMDRLIKALETYFESCQSEGQKTAPLTENLEIASSPLTQDASPPEKETPPTFESPIIEGTQEKPTPARVSLIGKAASFVAKHVRRIKFSWGGALGYILAVVMGVMFSIYVSKENANRAVNIPAQLVTKQDLNVALHGARETVRATGFLINAVEPDLINDKAQRRPNFNAEIIMVDPLNHNVVCLRESDEDNFLTYGKILLKIRIFHKNSKDLLGKRLKLYVADAYPTMSVIIIDDDLYAYFYPYNKPGTDSPILKFKNYAKDERAKFFIDHFNKLRDAARELSQDADFVKYDTADMNFKCPPPVSPSAGN